MTKRNTLIFIICYIAYTSIYIARLNLSMASPALIEIGIADTAQIGILGSVFSVVFACGRFINGGLGDRITPWKMICTGLFVGALSNIVTGILPPFWGMAALWGINAFAQSMLWSSVLCTVTAIYESEKAKKMTSYMVSSVATGNILGIVVNSIIVDKLGVNFAFVIPGAIMLIMSVVIFFFIKDINPTPKEAKKHISIVNLLRIREIAGMIPPVMFHGVLKDNISLWMTVYFVDRFLIDLSSTAGFVLFIPVVGFIGRALYPVLHKLFANNEKKVCIVSFTLCAVLSAILCIKAVSAVPAVIVLSLVYALISVINTALVSIYPIRFSNTGNVSSVSGLMDFATYLGAGISSWVYGIVIKHCGYTPMFASWAVLCALGRIILLKLKKKN